MVVASQCPTVVKIMLIRFDNAAETIVQLYDCSIATTMEPRDGVKYNDGVPRAQCACNREGFFFSRQVCCFLGPGSMLTAFLLVCCLFSFLLLFLLFCLSCFSAFPASSFLLLCFPCFSAFLLLCFCAFLLLLFYLFLFFSHVFCCSTSCSTASLLPVFTTCSFFSFALFSPVCVLNQTLKTLGETQRNLKEILISTPDKKPLHEAINEPTLKKP